jgi:hypothetical protein
MLYKNILLVKDKARRKLLVIPGDGHKISACVTYFLALPNNEKREPNLVIAILHLTLGHSLIPHLIQNLW